ncbi:CDAN1-interacting nuclease 1-like, partial [Aphomia sociella]
GIMNDNQYGPYIDIIRQSIGLEYELRLERELRLLNITFSDENLLRSRGYDKTPDFKLDVPIAVDGFIVNWVESKALFGDDENHSGYLKEQLSCYYNRFGPGLVIYWFGYLETLNSTPEVNNMFILRTSFPDKSSITQYKIDI